MTGSVATIRVQMSFRNPVYTPQQRDALGHAYVDLGMKPREIVAAAADGRLTLHGEKLEPFDVNPVSIATYGKRLLAKRSARSSSNLAALPHRDAVEQLRARLVTVADEVLTAYERQRAEDRDVERGRQIVRLVREAAALPAATDPTPPAPGAKRDGKREGAETKGGLAGALLADHRRTSSGGETAPDAHTPLGTEGDQNTSAHDRVNANAQELDSTEPTITDTAPGSEVRALADRVGLEVPGVPHSGLAGA